MNSPQLAEDGFTVLRGFIDRTEAEELEMLVDAAIGRPRDPACARPHNTLIPLRWDDAIAQRMILSHRRMQLLRGACSADDLKWISAYISIKEALSPPLWWHQDWWCWDHPVSFRREAAQIAVLCYLTDTTIHNGALRVLPGSHLESAPIHSLLPEAHGQTAETLPPAHAALGDLPGQRTLDLGAGDAVALDYRLLHGTHANASARRRECILLSFAPSWGGLPVDIRAHLIDHPAQPLTREARQALQLFSDMLPTFEGERRSLRLNRNTPARFNVLEESPAAGKEGLKTRPARSVAAVDNRMTSGPSR